MNALIAGQSQLSGFALFATMRSKLFQAGVTEVAANATDSENAADDLWRSFDAQVDDLRKLLRALEDGGHLERLMLFLARAEGSK